MYDFNKTVDGLAKYIDNELYAGMNDVQEFAARVFVGRILNNKNHIKELFINNGFFKSFGVIDSEGMVDLEGLAKDIKREIEKKEKITINVPFFGKYTFRPSDVDVLYKTITGEDFVYENN